MVIFQDSSESRHAEAAVLTPCGPFVRRPKEINAEDVALAEPITLHVGVNSAWPPSARRRSEGTAGTRWTYTASVGHQRGRAAGRHGETTAVHIGPETRAVWATGLSWRTCEQRLKNVEEPVRVFGWRRAAGWSRRQ